MKARFWKNKKVLITGHTGFQGSWLCLWLKRLGAQVSGYSLPPATQPNLFETAQIAKGIQNFEGDILDKENFRAIWNAVSPDIVFHLAAQSLVPNSFQNPLQTIQVNTLGTVNLLEIALDSSYPIALVLVTSDKCYKNTGSQEYLKEEDPLGGNDIYSASKAAAEILTFAYQVSFFKNKSPIKIATARAGNVIGGGDWSPYRLIPDLIKCLFEGKPLKIRNPSGVRPWQHVLAPLEAYLSLAEALATHRDKFIGPWNFGPSESDFKTVSWIAEKLISFWGLKVHWEHDTSNLINDEKLLFLDSSKANRKLNWAPRINLEEALEWTTAWYRAFHEGKNMYDFSMDQISRYERLAVG